MIFSNSFGSTGNGSKQEKWLLWENPHEFEVPLPASVIAVEARNSDENGSLYVGGYHAYSNVMEQSWRCITPGHTPGYPLMYNPVDVQKLDYNDTAWPLAEWRGDEGRGGIDKAQWIWSSAWDAEGFTYCRGKFKVGANFTSVSLTYVMATFRHATREELVTLICSYTGPSLYKLFLEKQGLGLVYEYGVDAGPRPDMYLVKHRAASTSTQPANDWGTGEVKVTFVYTREDAVNWSCWVLARNGVPAQAMLNLDIKECSSSPCANGATCTDQMGKYTCTCAQGFAGENCQNVIVVQDAPAADTQSGAANTSLLVQINPGLAWDNDVDLAWGIPVAILIGIAILVLLFMVVVGLISRNRSSDDRSRTGSVGSSTECDDSVFDHVAGKPVAEELTSLKKEQTGEEKASIAEEKSVHGEKTSIKDEKMEDKKNAPVGAGVPGSLILSPNDYLPKFERVPYKKNAPLKYRATALIGPSVVEVLNVPLTAIEIRQKQRKELTKGSAPTGTIQNARTGKRR